jgi:uncharacterized protein GlcG (DUF336 family)
VPWRTGLPVLMIAALVAQSADASPVAELTLADANRAVLTAVARCEQDGYRVSAAIVDRGGVLLALARVATAGPHTVDSSRKKAYTAASMRESTAKLAALIAAKPELQPLRDMNDSILMLGGGLPIRIGDSVVGGIGVGGAPGGHLDEACAQAGLAILETSHDRTGAE